MLTCEFWRHALQQSSAVWILEAPGWLPASSTMISPCTKSPLPKEVYTSCIARCLMRKALQTKVFLKSGAPRRAACSDQLHHAIHMVDNSRQVLTW